GQRTEVADVVTWLASKRGRQSIKTGIDINFIEQFGDNPLNTSGTYNFPKGAGPFKPLDSSTYPNRFTENQGDAHFDVHATIVSLFVQDEWQPHEGLSVNSGVRWDHTDWSGLPSRRDDVGPRLGVAFDPWKSGTTAFRTAIGRYYNELLMPIARDGAVGFVQLTISQPGYQGDPRTADPYGPNPRRPGPAQASFSVNRLAPTATPYTDQLSVGVQHQVGHDLGISIDLVRALGYR